MESTLKRIESILKVLKLWQFFKCLTPLKPTIAVFFINELVKDLIVGVVCQLLIEVLFD